MVRPSKGAVVSTRLDVGRRVPIGPNRALADVVDRGPDERTHHPWIVHQSIGLVYGNNWVRLGGGDQTLRVRCMVTHVTFGRIVVARDIQGRKKGIRRRVCGYHWVGARDGASASAACVVEVPNVC